MSTDYNAASWTASDLCSEVWRACHMPEGGTVDYPAAVVLRDASDVVWNFAGHALAKAGDGSRLATSLLRAVTSSSVVASGQDYELPPMAVGDAIEAVTWVDAAGTTRVLLQPVPIGLETTYSDPQSTGTPTHFAMLGDAIRVYPRPNVTGNLQIDYQRRHSELITDTANYGVITAISSAASGASTNITFSATPANILLDTWVDVLAVRYPYRYKLHGGKVISRSTTTVMVPVPFADVTAANVVGDTAVLYGRTPYVQLPLEFRGAVTKMIAAKILGDVGDVSMSAMREAGAERDMQRARDVLTPRVRKQKAFNPNSLGRAMGRIGSGIPRWLRRDD